MKVLIITSCTGEKIHSPQNQLTQDDFRLLTDLKTFNSREEPLAEYRTSAETLYTGQQHIRLIDGVRMLRGQAGADTVSLWVLSAGYGLVHGERKIVPYECTFQGMRGSEIRQWSQHLQVPYEARRLFAEETDLTLVLLGDSYLKALALDNSVQFKAPTIFLTSEGAKKQICGEGHIIKVLLSNREAKRFSCGLVALKGELARRILTRLSTEGEEFLSLLLECDADILALLEEGKGKLSQKKTLQSRANPDVDRVVEIPASWWQKPHREKLRYFIPEWDDLVDPDYDFETDTHSGGIGDWSNQVYAHQLYPEPNYDGILISKVVAEMSKKKKERINGLGVHRYLRLPREFPIMGDCGAFGYIMEEVPPYTTAEILDYYTRLGFDYGVSIDHLIVKATEAQKKFRYELTIHNAKEFLREHRKLGLQWEPIGAVQGWDPESYTEAARQYVAMGYKYIALGGLVRSNTLDILRVLEAVHKVVPDTVNIHLFGLARIRALADFARMGVRSVDSASYLRQAWMRVGQSYLSFNGEYAALRIPEAGKSFRAKRMKAHASLDEKRIIDLEQQALNSVRALSRHECSVDLCLNALLEYDQYVTSDRIDLTQLYLKTLTNRPWEQCDCSLCRTAGVEIIIFRGNNRNRRRGFHNTYVFYRLAQSILNGETLNSGLTSEENSFQQMPLFSVKEALL